MQSAFSNRKNHLAGFSVGQLFWTFIVDTEYGFITYNYYISDISDDSWVLGIGKGYYNRDENRMFWVMGRLVHQRMRSLQHSISVINFKI